MKTLSLKSFTGEMLATIQTSNELNFIYEGNAMLLESAQSNGVNVDLFLMKNNKAFDLTASIYRMIDLILDFDSNANIRTYSVLDNGLYQDSLFASVTSFIRK